jgi:hypothetical protein
MADILKCQTRIIQANTNPHLSRQLQNDLNKQFDALKSMVYF